MYVCVCTHPHARLEELIDTLGVKKNEGTEQCDSRLGGLDCGATSLKAGS